MEKLNRNRRKRWTVVFLIIAFIIVITDQLTKLWISSLLSLGQSIPETGFFQLTLVHNTGAAFGMFHGQVQPLTVVSFVGIILVLTYVFYVQRRFHLIDERLSTVAMGLILGGIIGNLIDRLRLGYVTDFIQIGIWPNFNIADSAVVAGTIIFAFSLYFTSKAQTRKESEANK